MKKIFTLLVLCCVSLVMDAQNTDDDFQTYRRNLLSNYHGFRHSVLEDYKKFLNGIWEDYEVFAGKKLRTFPKPSVQPQLKDDDPKPIPETIVPKDVIPANPIIKEEIPAPNPVVVSPSKQISFDWFGVRMSLPDANLSKNLNTLSNEDVIEYLNILNNSCLEKDVVPQMANIAYSCNLNDWCLYLLIESYVKNIKSHANDNTRNIICWYLLVQFGYDARLALNGDHLFFLIPFQQTVYARSYIEIHNKPYYIWGDGDIDFQYGFSSPELPGNTGKAINVVISKPLKIPYQEKRFSHSFQGNTLKVDVNENLVRLMNHFPQIPIPSYVVSLGDNKARDQLLAQIKQFIKGKTELEAANFILQFIQSFDYATDDEQFGYEKPFFIEETLYYPKCDCEDRSILYHYLVTQLLGRDVHLVHYSNHECTAVNFSHKINADSYLYNGKQYVICDPTYIGATIGMCMPDYRNVKPEIELVK